MVVASKKERKVACTKLQNDDLARCPKKGGANCSDLFLISLESLNGTAIYSYKTIGIYKVYTNGSGKYILIAGRKLCNFGQWKLKDTSFLWETLVCKSLTFI